MGDAPASAEIPVSTRILEQLDLVAGVQGGSFTAQLGGVQEKLGGEQLKAACGQLRAYMNHVKAQSGKALDTSLAGSLLLNAQGIGVAMGCWN